MKEKLLKLSGMAYHGGKSVDHWFQLVGVNVLECSPLIEIKNGVCYWTAMAERICRSQWDETQSWLGMLTDAKL